MNEAPEVVDVVDVPAAPAESPASAPVAPSTTEPDATERPEGIPAAHLAAGGLSGSAVVLGAIYQMLGLPGLIGGAVLAGSGTVAYLRHRYQRAHPHRGNSHRHGSGGGGRKESTRTVTTTGSTRRTGGGAGGLFSSGRSTGGGRSGGGAGGLFGKGGRGGGLLGGLGRSANRSGGGAGRAGGTGRAAGTAGRARGAAQRTGAAGRAFGSGARKLAHRAAQTARTAASRVNNATGGRAKKAKSAFGHAGRRVGRAVARQARRLGGAVDRRSGHRYSSAWKAIRQGGGLRAARRRGAAVLGGWDAQLTAGLLALVAWVVDRVKTRQAAPETASETNTGGEGDQPLTQAIECPRCKGQHTVAIPADDIEIWITCMCGLRIRVFRDPSTAFDDHATAQSTASTGPAPSRPYTAPIHRRTRSMSNNPLAAATAELNGAAAGHAPEDMWTVAREIDQIPEIPANVALALRTYTMRLQSGEYPIDPAVGEAMHQLYAGMAQLVSLAEEVVTVFRTVHAPDLARGEAPRTNEQMWDVGRQA